MEKLVMLLDIYEEEVVGVHSVGEHITEKDEAWIISKKFGFISWLVENDKIDLDKVENKFYNEICITDYGDKDRVYGKSDLVISVLSISSSPIDDLISYLR